MRPRSKEIRELQIPKYRITSNNFLVVTLMSIRNISSNTIPHKGQQLAYTNQQTWKVAPPHTFLKSEKETIAYIENKRMLPYAGAKSESKKHLFHYFKHELLC